MYVYWTASILANSSLQKRVSSYYWHWYSNQLFVLLFIHLSPLCVPFMPHLFPHYTIFKKLLTSFWCFLMPSHYITIHFLPLINSLPLFSCFSPFLCPCLPIVCISYPIFAAFICHFKPLFTTYFHLFLLLQTHFDTFQLLFTFFSATHLPFFALLNPYLMQLSYLNARFTGNGWLHQSETSLWHSRIVVNFLKKKG